MIKTAEATPKEADQTCLVVFGGWEKSTHREEIQPMLDSLKQKIPTHMATKIEKVWRAGNVPTAAFLQVKGRTLDSKSNR